MTAKKFALRPANIAYMDADCLDPKALAILHDSFDPVWHDGEWESILTDEQIQEAIDNTENVEPGPVEELKDLINQMTEEGYSSVCICS